MSTIHVFGCQWKSGNGEEISYLGKPSDDQLDYVEAGSSMTW